MVYHTKNGLGHIIGTLSGMLREIFLLLPKDMTASVNGLVYFNYSAPYPPINQTQSTDRKELNLS
jgi:hypothetical protein